VLIGLDQTVSQRCETSHSFEASLALRLCRNLLTLR